MSNNRSVPSAQQARQRDTDNITSAGRSIQQALGIIVRTLEDRASDAIQSERAHAEGSHLIALRAENDRMERLLEEQAATAEKVQAVIAEFLTALPNLPENREIREFFVARLMARVFGN